MPRSRPLSVQDVEKGTGFVLVSLRGSTLDVVSPGLGVNWLCMTEMTGGQLLFMLIMVTAVGRAISGCVLAVAYADIYGAPTFV
jgi:hypothetical protein